MTKEFHWWAYTPMSERRATLNEADLWDGSTYAERTWEELPAHIQAELEAARERRKEKGVCL